MARLDIFVSAHCPGCPEARRLAVAAAARFRALTVRLVDVGDRPEEKPARVVAVPAYLLDGRVVALGNPREADLFDEIADALAAEGAD